MTQDWTALVAGDRMAIDGEFTERVQASSLSSQQWSLVMTATEFEIESPETPEDARIVANTENLRAVSGEMKRLERTGPMQSETSGQNTGILRKIADKFSRDARPEVDFEEATELTEEYAKRLQERLIERGRWEEVCAHAAGE